MRHVSNALLAVVDGLNNGFGQLLEHIGELVFLRSSIARRGTSLRSCSDTSIGVKGPDCTIAFLKDMTSLLNKRLDSLDELLFVELVLGGSVGLLKLL
jgi:hypothetical protein